MLAKVQNKFKSQSSRPGQKNQIMKNLTTNELYLLSTIIDNVLGCMEYDKELNQYFDGGRFTMSMDKTEFNCLKNLKKKI